MEEKVIKTDCFGQWPFFFYIKTWASGRFEIQGGLLP